MSFDRIVQDIYTSGLSSTIRGSRYAVPCLQAVHLLGMTILLGTTVTLDAGLMSKTGGFLATRSAAAQVWRWNVAGLITMLLSGAMIFTADTVRYVANESFRTKMVLLCLAMAFHFSVTRTLTASGWKQGPWLRGAGAGVLSLALWFAVGCAGRAIAFAG